MKHTLRLAFIRALLLPLSMLLFSANSYAFSKQQCQYFDNKLDKVRSKLRYGYGPKEGERLKYQEKQIKRVWWLCINNKLDNKQLKQWKKKVNSMTKS
ncbi:hypothetical protein E2K93_04890 [Thalassotalea sp. HSM 43]|uniref:hypothetical protein n=1 Tax=Thalassotalea sp. HSM 43 TaxID=2552945 RepID=UPI0010816BD2|nr:hypothetical protein [Thalassotalea sp. HSM 43]QBY03757.1 hypothetical protein E2K93_04890 [Thalassotalea sp. HSM 43]